MQAGRQARGVVVPVEDVERGRRIAEQVVVDPVVPHQVVGPQPRENPAQRLAVEHAARRAAVPRRRDRLGRAEQPELRLGIEAEYRHHQRDGVHELLATGRAIAQQRRHRHRAGTGAMQVDIGTAGDIAYRMDRLDQRADIGVEVPVALRRRGIAPADHEHLQPLAQHVFHQALGRRKVEHVELVDLRRHDQLGPGMHFRRGRGVLDQLQHLVAEHHRARRDRKVLADAERVLVDLRGHAAVAQDIAGEVEQAADQVHAA
ncbi:hypothetical protein D9M72_382580 [compost metagenome]